jgi:peptidyl-tRNA hydrolase, PTH1 family
MKTRLVIGLGNPGPAYENTYHNAGALALQVIMTALTSDEVPAWETYKKLFVYAKTNDWIFVQPLTFMNESGIAVRAAVRKFKVTSSDIILLHDDSDLLLGTWKISRGRGAAGHHGAESVLTALGTDDVTRIRIGIRPASERVRKKAEDFVLKPITKSAALIFEKTFKEIACTLSDGIVIP